MEIVRQGFARCSDSRNKQKIPIIFCSVSFLHAQLSGGKTLMLVGTCMFFSDQMRPSYTYVV